MSITFRSLSLMSVAAFLFATTHPAAAQTYSETLLYSFSTVGSNPVSAGLAQGADGNFYGTTSLGGKSGGLHQDGGGTVFRITPSGSLTTLYIFCGQTDCTDGANPEAGLIQGTDGNFYGTTESGGTASGGTVFKVTPTGSLTTLYSFCSQPDCTDGAGPEAGLVQGTDGNFYGTTFYGGKETEDNTYGNGTVFKITPAGSLTTLYSFCNQAACVHGASPEAGLVQGTDGNFYGTTEFGGNVGGGTVFKIAPSGSLTTLYSFCGHTDCTDGDDLEAGLVQGTDGNFYGTTTFGGNANNAGTLFRITLSGSLTTLYTFCGLANCTDGDNPEAGLVQGTDGNFYGTTQKSGTDNSDGTIFKLTPSGSITTIDGICTPAGCEDGSQPNGALVQGSDGNFYGTAGGDASIGGAVYKLSVAPALKPPVQLSVSPVQVLGGGSFTLTYAVANASSDTMQYCFATNNAGNTVWSGVGSGKTTPQSATLTASSTPGTYTYALTCGGVESGFVTLIVKDATTASLTATPSPATVGQSVTLTANVAHTAGSATPTGTVNFKVGTTAIGSGTVNSSGVAMFSASTNGLPPGSYPVVATYSGDGNYDASTSAETTVTLNKAPTATTLTAQPNPVTPPLNVTLTATVARSASGAAGIPTGTVTFYYQTTALGTVGLNGSGVATVTAGSEGLAAGKYPITAKYNGDASDAASSSAAVTVTVK